MFWQEFIEKVARGFVEVMFDETYRTQRNYDVEMTRSMWSVTWFVIWEVQFSRNDLKEALLLWRNIQELRGIRSEEQLIDMSKKYDENTDVLERLGRQIQWDMDS